MKTNTLRPFSSLKWSLFTGLFISALTAGAFPVITNVVETGGDNEATDTIPAKWTGTTFVTGIANEPVPGKGANDPYTATVFRNWAPCYVDRNHRWTNASATVLLPPYLVGQEYIMSGNDNRDDATNPNYRLNVFVTRPVTVYMLIDNRMGTNTSNADPPIFSANKMQWILDEGWLPTTNGINRTSNPNVPDEVGVDEGADNTINNWSSVYYKTFPAGTFLLKQANNDGQNMYGVVVAAIPDAPNLVASSGDGKVTLNWNAGVGGIPTAYIVKRSLFAGGPYDVVTTNSSISYIDLTVVNGQTYYYVVSAFNSAGESPNSNEAAATPKAAPTGVAALGGVGQIQISWNAFPDAASYTVSRATNSGGPYTSVASGVTDTSYIDSTVEAGRTYYYVVTAQLNGGGDSGQSAEVSAFAAPGAPTLTVARWSVRGIELRWTSGGQNVSGYSVEQSTDGVNFTPLATTGTQRTYVDAGLQPTTTYYYRVQAQNTSGASPYSNIGSLTTLESGFNVNFANALNGQPANDPAPIPPDYVQDIGEVYGLRTNGLTYGWNRDITADGRWRKNPNSPDLRFDTFNHLQKLNPSAIWEIEIPNGFYSVHTVSGDPNNVDSLFQLEIEGFVTPVRTTAAGNWAQFTVEVGVNDGRLTITTAPDLRNVTTNNNKLNFVEIYPATPVPPSIVTQPTDATGEAFHPAGLSVSASGSFPLIYQWYHDGNPVPGNSATLAFPYSQTSDSGQYYVVITNWGGSVTSAVVNLTISPDTTPPVVISAETLDGKYLGICFSEELDNAADQLTDTFNYLINGGVGATNVILRPDRRSILLDLDPPISGQYTLEMNTQGQAHRDLAGNPLAPTTLTRTVGGYLAGDVGAVGLIGRHFACGDEIEIVGGGTDVWGAADQFYFVSKSVDGNFDARVHVTSLAGSNAITKALLFARESTNTDARAYHISVNPTPPGRNQLELGLRSTVGGATAAWGGTFLTSNIPAVWMRITRVADTFTGYRSSNGVDWIAMGTNVLALPPTMSVGIGVTAHDNTLLATGVFSNFRIIQDVPRPVMNNLSYSGTQFSLSFLSQAGATYQVEYSDSLTPPDWHPLQTVPGDGSVKNIADPNATVTTRFYRIRAQ